MRTALGIALFAALGAGCAASSPSPSPTLAPPGTAARDTAGAWHPPTQTARLLLQRKFDLDQNGVGYLYIGEGLPEPPQGFVMAFVYRYDETVETELTRTMADLSRVNGVENVEAVGATESVAVSLRTGRADAVRTRYRYTFRGKPTNALMLLIPSPSMQPWVKIRISAPADSYTFDQIDTIAAELLAG